MQDTALTEGSKVEMMTSIIDLQKKQTEIADRHSLNLGQKVSRLEEEKQIQLSGIDAKFTTTTTTKDRNNISSITFQELSAGLRMWDIRMRGDDTMFS